MSELNTQPAPRGVIIWLLFCAFMVFTMTIIGAITRLTESGLSMVEWQPLIGAIPPLSEAEWNRVFDLYKQSPEYQKVNFWMGLDDFKRIFFWEWFHRLWGRLIGLVFALPLVFFWLKGMIPSKFKLRFLGLLALGAAQGGMGWYMVKSGLVDIPAVSHYRLAAHLGLAIIIYALLIWQALSMAGISRKSDRPLFFHAVAMLAILSITIVWGAFTAGLDAGLLYNDSFPKMGGQWIPPDLSGDTSFLMNLIKNPSGVQFAHRWLAIVTVAAGLSFWAHGIIRKKAFKALHAVGLFVTLQFALGLATLFSNVHIHAAATHQGGALLLLTALIVSLHRLRR